MDAQSAEQIRSVIKASRKLPARSRMRWICEHHPDFARAYPALVRACADDKFDFAYLDVMLEERRRMAAQETTSDAADSKVYGMLRKQYVDPVFPPSSAPDGPA